MSTFAAEGKGEVRDDTLMEQVLAVLSYPGALAVAPAKNRVGVMVALALAVLLAPNVDVDVVGGPRYSVASTTSPIW